MNMCCLCQCFFFTLLTIVEAEGPCGNVTPTGDANGIHTQGENPGAWAFPQTCAAIDTEVESRAQCLKCVNCEESWGFAATLLTFSVTDLSI